jgi:UDP-N-acetylmuramyl tripeptide synthase
VLWCHSKCERYAAAKAKAEERKEIERERRSTSNAADEYTIKQAANARRKKLPQR